MIVTDKFVFVHFPRTGGTFVTDMIMKFFPSAREIGYHLPRSLLPKEYSNLPVLGAVRNPWEFYVSWYYHIWPRDIGKPLFSWLTNNCKEQFEGAIRNALNLGVDNNRLDALIEKLPATVDYRARNIPNITKDSMSKARGTGVGYCTFRFNQLFGNADEVFFCRLETLRQDLVSFFEGIGAANDELRDYVLCSDKKNISEHLHYSTYYTPELAELVSIRDALMIERFGYVFERPSSVEKGESKFEHVRSSCFRQSPRPSGSV
jgi:hypothetical protein